MRPLLACLMGIALTLTTGCREEPSPRAIDIRPDPRVKRFDMTNVEPAAVKR